MKEVRVTVRLNPETKALLVEAADLRGETLTQFVVSTLSEAAEKVVAASYCGTGLSRRDRDLFLRLLDNPPAPNAALQRAAARYMRQSAR
jgi:uncharacterized protein (DUF1778 family)